jgi:hypothetical protein
MDKLVLSSVYAETVLKIAVDRMSIDAMSLTKLHEGRDVDIVLE